MYIRTDLYRQLNLLAIANSFTNWLLTRPQPIMLKFLPIMFLSSAQKVTHYAQYYAHNYFIYATVQPQILKFL